jgi:uncharacterized membrane protein
MDKRVKTMVSAAVITAAGTILPTLAALLVYGFSINCFAISNYIFTIGMFTAAAGGVWSILPFFRFKSKLRKTKIGEKVEVQTREGLRWEYILMVSGVIIIVISYFVAVL